MSKPKSHIQYRNDRSGRFVPDSTGKQRPETHTREHVPNSGHGDTGRYDKKPGK